MVPLKSRRPARPSHVAVLAGGRGTRFWPVGREGRPKQMLALDGDDPRPLLRATVDRVAPLCEGGAPWVVASQRLRGDLRRLLPDVPRERLLLEPAGRNTAAAVCLAAHAVEATAPGAVLAVVPSDHHVAPVASYRRALRAMLARAARSNAVVTLGLRPSRPATGYGYVRVGRLLARTPAGPVHAVAAFVEKPDLATARRFVRGRRHLWNGGTFVFRPSVLLAEAERRLPAVARPLAAAAKAGLGPRAIARAYARLPSVSVDHGIMEKARGRLEVLAASLAWDDLGSWDAVGRHARHDAAGNALGPGHLAVDARGCLVRATDGGVVVLLGVDDLIVVRTWDATLVARRGRGEDVRAVVEALRKAGRDDLLR